ncbi:MAG: hypothetical protein M3075_11275 [Candidatus Dormibacteraeota bacterium]|nr:hypothetical protein [Candidatus Dormibacteraeota bacterium]
MSEIQRHRFGPRVKGGIVFGLRGGQLGIMTAVLILMTIAVRSTSSIAGALVGLAIFGAGLAIAFLPIRRRALDQWLPVFASYLNRQLSGHTRWLSRAHLQGHLWSSGRLRGPQDQPPGLKGVEILSVTADFLAGEVSILRDGKRYIGVSAAHGQSFALMDHEDQALLGNAWAGIIGAYGVPDSLIRRIGFVERAMPEDPGALRTYALEKIPELVGTRTREEVETRLEELPELRANHIRGYLEGVELTGPAARQHECFVSLELDTSSPRVSKQCKRIGRGDVQRGACEVLMRALADLEERLETGLDLRVEGQLSPRQLAKVVRTHYQPAARMQRTRLEQNGAQLGEPTHNAAPRAFAEYLDHVQADGAAHTTYHVVEFPRQDVSMTFMAPVFLHTKAARTVAMVMEPVDPQKAGREIDASHFVRNMMRRGREHYGFESTFRQRSEDEKVEQVGEEHAAGHVNVRFSAYITVSAENREDLEWATAEVETQAAQALLELERLWGQQGPAFTYTLPLCRGL